MLTKLVLVATAAALTLASAARAEPPQAPFDPDAASVKVSLEGLDLSSNAGAATALRRVRAAAISICGTEPSFAELDRRRLFDRCVADTVDRAVVSMHNPRIVARNGRPEAPVAASGHASR